MKWSFFFKNRTIMKILNNTRFLCTSILILSVFFIIGCDEKQQIKETVTENLAEIPSVLDLNNLSENGIFSLKKQVLTPNKKGIIADIVLKLPAYKNGMYYRPFSEVKASGNRMEAL